MKKKVLPVLIVIALILFVLLGVFIKKLVDKYTPTDERIALTEQYKISSEEEVPIILNQKLLSDTAFKSGDSIYLDFEFVQYYINPRFYWDNNENLLLYTTASDLITVNAESTSYLINKSSNDFSNVIVKVTPEHTFVNVDFIKQYSDFQFEVYDDLDCTRLLLWTDYKDYETVAVKKDTEIRVLGGIKSPILTDVTKEDTLYVLEDYDDWKQVMTKSGIIGFISTKKLGKASTETIASDYVAESFSHIKKDFTINMVWHQVFNTSANGNVSAVLSTTKGVNVISPTWFYLSDNNGNLHDIASNTYVNYCHQQGIEVWALFSNIESKDVDTTEVLTHTSSRQNLVNQIVSMAIQYNLDGVNIDFEAMDKDGVGDSFIQFIRELSLKCENNDIVLSVDNYVPTEYTSFYYRDEQALFADYVCIMGYDEHYGGANSNGPGSLSSIPWLTQGIEDTKDEVPADQIILGLPFYNRVWTVTAKSGGEESYTEFETDCYSVSMDEGANILSRNGATLTWLDDLGQNYGEFDKNGTTYKIWLEDVDSLTQKLELQKKYNLAGACFWKVGLESSNVWDTIIKYLN